MNYVIFGNTKIPYKIIQSKRKTTEILVDGSSVMVLASKSRNKKIIHNIVQNYAKWIFKKQLEFQNHSHHKITFKNKSKLPHLGKWYLLDIKKSNSNYLEFKDKIFHVSLNKPTKNNIKKLYLDWEKEKAEQLLKNRIELYSKFTKLFPSKILVKPLKTKWGGVSKKRTLTINQKLIRAPKKIIDYVIIHELCHLKIPNHGRFFWNMVSSKISDHDRRRLWLKQNYHLLE